MVRNIKLAIQVEFQEIDGSVYRNQLSTKIIAITAETKEEEC